MIRGPASIASITIVVVIASIALFAVFFFAASAAAQARSFGDQYAPLRFFVPGYNVDAADPCPGDSSSVLVDAFVAHVEHRPSGIGDFVFAGDLMRDGDLVGGILGLDPAGEELVLAAYRPPASGLWELRVSILNTNGARSCFSDTLVGYWNLSEIPARPSFSFDP